MIPELGREEVLAHRWWAHGLDRPADAPDLVLALGLQDTPYGSARRALAARAAAPTASAPLVWTWRGAPHLHRPQDLPSLARALWPVSDTDATKRIATTSIREGARRGVEAFTVAAIAMRNAVTHRMPKGEVSRLVSEQVPDDLTYDCEPCGSRHVAGTLFQQVGLAAGVQVVPEGRSSLLEPLPDDVRPAQVPQRSDGVETALLRYVALHGPAAPAHLAAWLGTTVGVAKALVPPDVVEVDGPAGRGWMTPTSLEQARTAPPPQGTRLLPPSDPWLQARDREVVVPDVQRRKAVWRAVSSPGVVLVDGEVVGLWRATSPARRRLRVSVEPFDPPTARLRAEVEAEAHRVAAARATTDTDAVEVVVAD